MTPFEAFFAGPWEDLLASAKIPAEAWSTPPSGKDPVSVSWDRRAAWLLFSHARDGSFEVEPENNLTEDGY